MVQTFQDLQRGYMDVAKAGMLANTVNDFNRNTYFNSGRNTRQSIADVVIGGTVADGDTVTITIGGTSPQVGVFSEAIQVVAEAGDTVTTLGDKLVAAIANNEAVNDLLSASNVAGTISFSVYEGRMIDSIAAAATGTTTALPASPTITAAVTSPIIPYGYVVGRYPIFGDKQCALPNSATDLTALGVAMYRDHAEHGLPFDEDEVQGYSQKEEVFALTEGEIWVPAAAGCVRDSLAFFDPTTGQFQPNGTGTAFPGGRYVSTQEDSGLIRVHIDVL